MKTTEEQLAVAELAIEGLQQRLMRVQLNAMAAKELSLKQHAYWPAFDLVSKLAAGEGLARG